MHASHPSVVDPVALDTVSEPQRHTLMKIPIDMIDPDPNQPRQEFPSEYINNLASSMVTEGQLVPINVKKKGEDRYGLVDGECRLRAARIAGVEYLLAICNTDEVTDRSCLISQLVINCQREDLNPMELAVAYAHATREGGLSLTELAARLNITKGHVSNQLTLNSLDPVVKELVAQRRIPMGTATQIARLPKDQQLGAAQLIVEGSLRRQDLQERRSRTAAAKAGGGIRRISLKLPQMTAQFAATSRFSLEDLLQSLQGLLKEAKKAQRQGLDISTFASVLEDTCGKAESKAGDA